MNTSAAVTASDIEGSADFQALLVAAAGKPERSMGDSVIPAEAPVWSEVRQLAKRLLSDPPHLSVIVHLVKADAHVGGFSAMHESFQLLHDSLTSSWDSMLPEADPDDEDDPYYERVNYLREIAEDPSFINGLKSVKLVDVRGIGAFSSRDIDIANGQVTASEDEQARCQEGLIRAAFEQADAAVIENIAQSLPGIVNITRVIEVQFDENAGSDHGLNFAPLRNQLEGFEKKFKAYAGNRLVNSDDSASTPDMTASGDATDTDNAANKTGDTGRITGLSDRSAVTQAFDQIIEYYQRSEPSSPVPVLAQRARDMVTKSFFDVLEDLAPAEKGTLSALLGVLSGNPMASLLSDSYQRFLSGEPIAPQSSTNDTNATAVQADTSDDQTELQSAEPETSQPSGSIIQIPLASLQSRNEVAELLNSIDGYFNQHEPSSPVPLIVAEIRKLLPKRFTELIEEFNRVLNSPVDTTGE